MEGGDRLYEEIVDAANAVFGSHPRSRALHAKGTWCRGSFTGSSEARRLSRAPHFAGQPVPALVRFSNASGDPGSHDADRDGRGMAVKLSLPNGGETDILATMAPAFASRTPEDFLELLRRRAPDPETGKPDMESLGAYLGKHPEARPALQSVLGSQPPASFAQLTYHSPHAFRLVNADGDGTWARYRWRPEAGEDSLPDEDARRRGPDYLREELAQRLVRGPVRFELRLQLGEEDDSLTDPTKPWPAERQTIAAGRLAVEEMVEDPETGGNVVVFDPTRVTDGIELSQDPVLHARTRAYSVSVERRAGSRRRSAGRCAWNVEAGRKSDEDRPWLPPSRAPSAASPTRFPSR